MNELVRWLPAVNASLNGLATVLLLCGYAAIRRRRIRAHASLMLSAFATSVVFLGCYLVYHWALHSLTGEAGKKFTGVGMIRPVYFTILITHVILAAAVPVLALMTIYRAWRRNWIGHKRIAVITFPIWVYVSVTGVIIYLMLYHWPVGA
jgi:protein SCO1